MTESKTYNMDCMEAMREMPDNYYDLAVVDPPYGAGGGYAILETEKPEVRGQVREVHRTGGTWAAKYGKKIVSWDHAPGEDYFQELFRVSRNQIIWGGNYFGLPPTRCFIIWEKPNIPENFSMAQCEYAWCSFNENAKIVKLSSAGQKGRFHPSQKPVELYQWIYSKYAKPGDKILDTHMGSGSSRIAAYDMDLDFTGYEIDKDYFQKEEERFREYTKQARMW